MRLTLLNACNDKLAHIEERYPAPDLRIILADKAQTAKLNGRYTRDGRKGMMEGRNYCAIEAVCPFVAALVDRTFGFVERWDLTLVSVLYIGIPNKSAFRSRRRREGGG